MIDITAWMDGFLKALHDTFGNRIWFVGLQGSYGRGEATETSDIDVVVILDELSASDIGDYDTTPIKGSLDELLTLIDETAIRRAIKIGACNVYHGCVHNMLHEKSEDILRGLYKSASFVVQAIAFKQTGKYIKYQKDLLGVVSADEQKIIETFLKLKNGEIVEFDAMSEELFTWAKKWITESN